MNTEIWDALKRPPEEALKKITGGRLSGMTDISPTWRYRALTERFGPCGFGWRWEIDKLWLEPGTENQVAACAMVNLFIKNNGEWSEKIPGIGGSMFLVNERNGPHTNDEAYKMAVTDALSTAAQKIGLGADIYAGKWDGSKYNDSAPTKQPLRSKPTQQPQKETPNQNTNKDRKELERIRDLFATPEEVKDIDDAIRRNVPAILQGKYNRYYDKYFSGAAKEKQKSEQQELGVNVDEPPGEPTARELWYNETNFLDPKTTKDEMVRVIKELVDINGVTGAVAFAFMIKKKKTWSDDNLMSLTKPELKEMAEKVWEKKGEKNV